MLFLNKFTLVKRMHSLYQYLAYSIKAVNEHGVHSPFVFDLLLGTIYNNKDFYAYAAIENLREELLYSQKIVKCKDPGAGSVKGTSAERTVKQLARRSANPPEHAQLLFRLANHFQPSVALELGTSLGISTAYLASANSKTKLITIEGCEEIAAMAKENFRKLELNNIEAITGNFDDVLPGLLKEIPHLDLVFFDGNHRKAPTLNYFRQCLEKASETSVFIFDDIYWSAEMTEAWNEIKNHEQVTVTLDLFQLGIVFFRKEQAKENFIIRF
jgi:predicted O-methyltransferase YrrM